MYISGKPRVPVLQLLHTKASAQACMFTSPCLNIAIKVFIVSPQSLEDFCQDFSVACLDLILAYIYN